MSEQSDQQQDQQQSSPLQTDRGRTTVQKPVVTQAVGMALQEIEGIRMGSGSQSGSTGSGEVNTQGVSVEVGREEAAVDLTIRMEYGRTLTEVTDTVRRNVVSRVENMTGLRVVETNIRVVDFYFPDQDQGRRR